MAGNILGELYQFPYIFSFNFPGRSYRKFPKAILEEEGEIIFMVDKFLQNVLPNCAQILNSMRHVNKC